MHAWGSVCLDTMPHETLPTIDELNRMDDLSGATFASNAMRWQVTYHDPLVTRQRDQPLANAHPTTVSLEDRDVSDVEAPLISRECQFVYDALQQLSKRHQVVLVAACGLPGERVMKNEDIAAMLRVSK